MLNNHALLPESLVHFVLLLYTGRMKCDAPPKGFFQGISDFPARHGVLAAWSENHYYGTPANKKGSPGSAASLCN